MQAEEPLVALKEPAGHGRHCSPYGPEYPALQTQPVAELPASDHVLFAHGAHEEVPVVLAYCPAGQVLQTVALVAAVALENVPGRQGWQKLARVELEYVPPGHGKQALEFKREKYPRVQFRQEAGPVVFLKVPAGHARHVATESVYPAVHRQVDTLVLPTGELEKFLHGWHADAPFLSEYVPA